MRQGKSGKTKKNVCMDRLVLVSEGEQRVQASLSAMTCVHGSLELYTAKSAALGPDPLREDAGDASCSYLPAHPALFLSLMDLLRSSSMQTKNDYGHRCRDVRSRSELFSWTSPSSRALGISIEPRCSSRPGYTLNSPRTQ
jgi:hypothetical protein